MNRLGTHRRGLMSRFKMNRQMALILTLAATLVLGSLPVPTLAVPIDAQGKGPAEGDGGNHGDPDVPTGATRGTSTIGVRPTARPMVQIQANPVAVADGRGSQLVWMWRLRIVLQGLRISTFHF